jgi:hypothetical protein
MAEIAASLSSPRAQRIAASYFHRVITRATGAAVSSARQAWLSPGRLLWTFYFCAAAFDELEHLTDADFDDMPFARSSGRAVAWQEARQRVGELPDAKLLVATAIAIAAAVIVVIPVLMR